MTPRRPYYAKQGWTNRYPILLWLQDTIGLVGGILLILAVGFWATWTGQ